MNNDSTCDELTPDQEVWGMALWVERVHGDSGWLHIAMEQDRLLAAGELDGVALWRRVQRRWEELQASKGCQQ
ncbi:MAG: hypothetical protein V4647_06165 [Pseudomonadota bacterium]